MGGNFVCLPQSHQKTFPPSVSRIHRVQCPPGASYEVIFLDQQEHIVVPLTEWYRLRKSQGASGTKTTFEPCSPLKRVVASVA